MSNLTCVVGWFLCLAGTVLYTAFEYVRLDREMIVCGCLLSTFLRDPTNMMSTGMLGLLRQQLICGGVTVHELRFVSL